jgi:YHS domain-containing protein
MMLIELFVPKGALTEERRRRVGQRLLAELTHVEGAPPAVLDAARALWHVVVHEPDAWIAGGRPVEPTEPARYFVRMSVPSDGSSLTDEVRAGYVSTITRVLAETDEDPQRLYREPHAWVHIIDVPEGSFGALGRAMRNADIIKMVMGTAGTAPDAASPVAPGSDTAIDPTCGMTVALTDTAIAVEHDGASYAFCSPGCREIFAEQHAGSAP